MTVLRIDGAHGCTVLVPARGVRSADPTGNSR